MIEITFIQSWDYKTMVKALRFLCPTYGIFVALNVGKDLTEKEWSNELYV